MRSSLIRKINKTLRNQGYDISKGVFSLIRADRENLRRTHALAKKERLAGKKAFLRDHRSFINDHMIDGRDLNIENISPKLIPVTATSHWEKLFRWWNFVWWSMPYEPAYGRQMRYIVWDQHHEAVIGLIGLHSPILSWAPRDRYLGLTPADRDYWVNQSLSAQRVGAVPPYNIVLGGKLVAMLMTSDTLRKDFRRKYSNKSTLLQKRELPANLLFITTTGAFGKSSLYTRLKFGEEWLASFIGYSNGSGSFHVPDAIYEQILLALSREGVNVKRGYGSGHMFITQSLESLDDEIIKQMRIFAFGHGLTMGSELRKVKEIINNQAAVNLYSSFIDPSNSGKFPFMFFGPVSPFSATGSPLFVEIYSNYQNYCIKNQ